jgi:hypothetical protein
MAKKYFVLMALFFVLGFAGFVNAQNTNTSTLIAQLMAQIDALLQQIAQLQTEESSRSSWCYDFNNNLGSASTNITDIMNLHTVLKKEGISYGSDRITQYGIGTATAVSQLQKKYASEILDKFGLTNGTGYLGRSTREKLNRLYGCSPVSYETPTIATETGTTGLNCTDSDGGKNYYVRGSLGGLCAGGGSCGSWIDSCRDSVLTEYFCDGNNVNTNFVTYTCPNGCENGACKEGIVSEPACLADPDCGISNYIDSPYCNSTNTAIYQKYITYICKNPGASNSYCAHTTTAKLKQTCPSSQVCANGSCVGQTIACRINSDCGTTSFTGSPYCASGDIYQNQITYICKNAGTTSSYCSNSTGARLKQDCQYGCEGAVCATTQPPLSGCVDSDGLNYFNAGYITVNAGRYEDYCHTDGQRLIEYKCLNGALATDTVACQNECENGACKQVSDNSSINLISPNGGETWARGSSFAEKKYKITWSSQNLNPDSMIGIRFTKARSSDSTGVYTGSTRVSAGEFTISLGVTTGTSKQLLPDGEYKITLSATDHVGTATVFAEDISDGYITINDGSNSGKSIEAILPDSAFLRMGETYSIKWNNVGYDDTNYYAKVYLVQPYTNKKILISSDAGTSVTGGSLNWTVPFEFDSSFGFVKNTSVYVTEVSVYKKSDNSIVSGDQSPCCLAIGKYPNSEYCTDSDDGLDYYTYGKVKLKNISYTEYGDFCNSTKILKEVACKPTCTSVSDPYSCYYEQLFTCPENYTCKSGACVLTTTSYDELNSIYSALAAISEKVKQLLGL